MKTGLLFILLLILLPCVVALQDLLPSLPPAQERILLLPLLFCFGVMVLPLLPALLYALIVAVVQGLILLQVEAGQVELGLVGPVVFYFGWAIFLQMANDTTRAMRWEIHAIASAMVTLSLLTGEFLILCAKRGGFPLDATVLLRIGVPSAAALLIAPFFYLLLRSLAPLDSRLGLAKLKPPGQEA